MDVEMILRPATDTDSYFFLHLRNDRDAVLMSHRPAVSIKEHAEWWAMTTDERWVAEVKGERIGILRISFGGEVSLVVAPEHRGKGHGVRMLELIKDRIGKHHRLIAEVLPENTRSQGVFLGAGWVPILFQWP